MSVLLKARQVVHSLRMKAAGVSVRYMYDSADPVRMHGVVGSSPSMVAGYISGYAWDQADWDLFPHSVHVRIATRADINDGDVLDVEPGDATIGEAPGWIVMRRAAGYHRPTIYTSLSNLASLRAATGSLKLGVDYDVWLAQWTGSPHHVAGCVATQYVDRGYADVSSVYDSGWPHRTAAKPKPAGPVQEPVLRLGASGAAVTLLQNELNKHDAKLAVDGKFGAKTEAHVKDYQRARKLTVDGIVGAATWKSLGHFV